MNCSLNTGAGMDLHHGSAVRLTAKWLAGLKTMAARRGSWKDIASSEEMGSRLASSGAAPYDFCRRHIASEAKGLNLRQLSEALRKYKGQVASAGSTRMTRCRSRVGQNAVMHNN